MKDVMKCVAGKLGLEFDELFRVVEYEPRLIFKITEIGIMVCDTDRSETFEIVDREIMDDIFWQFVSIEKCK